IGLQASNAHEALKSIGCEPMLVALGLERVHQVPDFAAADGLVKRNVKIRRAEIAIILRDFVFEYDMISPRIPGQLIDHMVILMKIVTRVRENQIREYFFLQFLELVFYFGDDGREIPIAKVADEDILLGCSLQEKPGAAACFTFSFVTRAENHPIELDPPRTLQELEN